MQCVIPQTKQGEKMIWHKIELTIEQQANNEIANIQKTVTSAWRALGAPKGVTLWGSNGSPVVLYFSPDASKLVGPLMKIFNGATCNQPSAQDVSFLLGHESDRIQLA
jgi:hypothetical protein